MDAVPHEVLGGVVVVVGERARDTSGLLHGATEVNGGVGLVVGGDVLDSPLEMVHVVVGAGNIVPAAVREEGPAEGGADDAHLEVDNVVAELHDLDVGVVAEERVKNHAGVVNSLSHDVLNLPTKGEAIDTCKRVKKNKRRRRRRRRRRRKKKKK